MHDGEMYGGADGDDEMVDGDDAMDDGDDARDDGVAMMMMI